MDSPAILTDITWGDWSDSIRNRLNGRKAVCIVDENVKSPKSDILALDVSVIWVRGGEASKSIEMVCQLYDKLLELGIDRSHLVVGIGGGSVLDLVGFLASTYMRGLDFGFVPTTLLSQVDASIGGKNGINFMGKKNLIGTISQPEFVVCDPKFVIELPEPEFVNGLAEVVKHALIADAQLFKYLEHKSCRELRTMDSLERMVVDSQRIKLSIVSQDTREEGLRTLLNFGHTLGHAFEQILSVPHGIGVAMGMIFETKLLVAGFGLSQSVLEKLQLMLERLGLPGRYPEVASDSLLEFVRHDKKVRGNKLLVPALLSIGSAEVQLVDLKTYERLICDLC